LNDQAFGRYDQDFRFGAVNLKSAFCLVKSLEDNKRVSGNWVELLKIGVHV